MHKKIGLLNHWTLLAINILIISAVEISGNFFSRTGLIHILAVIFVGLGFLRLLFHAHVHDQFLEPIIHNGIFALVVLAFSHIVEYASYRYFKLPRQTIYANVINFYMIGLLVIALGVEGFWKGMQKSSKLIISLSWLGIVVFLGLITFFIVNPKVIELESTSWQVLGYVGAIIFVAGLSIWRLLRLKKHVSIMVNFVNYFIAAIALIGFGALISTTEEVITNIGVPSVQIAFLHHFLFYGALSLMYLAYERLLNLGGTYEDLEALEKEEAGN